MITTSNRVFPLLGRSVEVAWTPDGDERRGLSRYDGRSASAPGFLAPLDNGGEVAPLIVPDGSYALITLYENGLPQALAFPLDGGPPALLGENRALGWR
ncbi:MAG: hypothetical protein OHK0022_25050 [Roseiflexaceae bacterium]